MSGRRWRWWRGQGSQRKRSLHAWMRWDKHSDILSRVMCARNECDNARLWRLTTTRTFTCSPSVSRHCWVSCASCWCFSGSWFSRCHWCWTSHRSAGWFYTSTAFHHAYAILTAKFFPSGCCRLCLVIVNSICIPNSCIFHIAKTGLLRCCLYTGCRWHKEGWETKLKTNRLGLSWTDKGSKSSLTVRRRWENMSLNFVTWLVTFVTVDNGFSVLSWLIDDDDRPDDRPSPSEWSTRLRYALKSVWPKMVSS